MNKRIHSYLTIGLLAAGVLFSCEEEYEPATITFYPSLAGEGSEPDAGADGAPINIALLTSRVVATESQVNIRIAGEGAGYGFSYTTNPPMLQPGILTLTIPAGEAGATFSFIPKNDGIFIPNNYHYNVTVEQMSNSIRSTGQETFTLTVKDNTEPFLSFNFDNCSGSPAGFQEVKGAGTVMQASNWGCSQYGYPNETTYCAEANAYGKGGSAASNSYLILSTPIDGTQYSTLHISALVYSRFAGQGTIKFRYSTNYPGSGNAEADGVVWNDLTTINNALPAPGSQTWEEVGALIEGVPDTNVYIAIQFIGGTTTSSSSWRIENLELKGI